MKSRTTRKFRELFAILPAQVQQQARIAYRLFQQNPAHPGLRFKQVNVKLALYSARVGLHYRAVGRLIGNTIAWFWVGTHAEYDKLLDQL